MKSLLIDMGFSSSLVHRVIDENGIHKGVQMDEILNFLVAAQLDEKYAEDSQDLSDGTETNREDDDVVVLSTEVIFFPSFLLASFSNSCMLLLFSVLTFYVMFYI